MASFVFFVLLVMECSQTKTDAWSVVCLCAAWCGVCREYQPGFEALARKFPATHWAWVDVEDCDDVVGVLDVETFPTLLIACGETVVFFGPLLPQLPVLERLVQTLQQGDGRHKLLPAQVQDVWKTLRATLV